MQTEIHRQSQPQTVTPPAEDPDGREFFTLPFAAVARAVEVQAQAQAMSWGVEFEQEMRRDIAALTGFITRDLAPLLSWQGEAATVADSVARFDMVLRGCGADAAPAGMADYAWALNYTLAETVPLFIALETLQERDDLLRVAAMGGGDGHDYHGLMAAFDDHYRRAARWLDDINMAFAVAHPDAVARIEASRESGDSEGPLHRQSEAEIYTGGYPLTGVAPLQDRAAIFAPYARQRPAVAGACPAP